MGKRRRGRGEGGVQQLKSGSWRAVRSAIGPDGKRIRVSKAFPDKTMALEWLRSQTGTPAAGTLSDWLAQWLLAHRGKVAERTYADDLWRVNRHVLPGLGSVRLRDLTGLKVEQFLAAMATAGASASERQKAGAVLRKALNAAVGAGVLSVSPMARVRLPRPRRPEKRSLTVTELRHLIDVADSHGLGAMVRLWTDAGLRPGEVLGLRWEDVLWDHGRVWIRRTLDEKTGEVKEPKTRRSVRQIAVTPETMASLARHRDGLNPPPMPAEPVFPGRGRCHQLLSNFSPKFRKLVKTAGLGRLRPYDLRHTCATLLLQAGVSVRVVSDRLGHEDIQTTLANYAHAMPGDQERAAAAMEKIFGDL